MTSPPVVSITARHDNSTLAVDRQVVADDREVVKLSVTSPECGVTVVRLSPGEAVRLARALRSATAIECDSSHIETPEVDKVVGWPGDLDEVPISLCEPWDWPMWKLQHALRLGQGDPEQVAAALAQEYSHRVAYAVLAAYPLARSLVVELHDAPPYLVFGGAVLAVLDGKGRTLARPAAADEDDDLVFDQLDAVLDGLFADLVATAPEGSAWRVGRRVLDLPNFLTW